MVDRSVPGVVEVTPAQIEAARALAKWERAAGRHTEGAIEAIARLKPDEPGESAEIALAKVEALTDTVSRAMESIAHLAQLRLKLAADNPALDQRLIVWRMRWTSNASRLSCRVTISA